MVDYIYIANFTRAPRKAKMGIPIQPRHDGSFVCSPVAAATVESVVVVLSYHEDAPLPIHSGILGRRCDGGG